MNPDPVQIQAAGGLLFRQNGTGDEVEVLLIHRNNCWDLPKGKIEKGESIPECALREVKEEIGLTNLPVLLADLCTTYHTFTRDSQTVEKETFWFVMKLAESQTRFFPQKEEGITRAEWFSPGEAAEKVEYQNLKGVIQRFLKNTENIDKIQF